MSADQRKNNRIFQLISEDRSQIIRNINTIAKEFWHLIDVLIVVFPGFPLFKEPRFVLQLLQLVLEIGVSMKTHTYNDSENRQPICPKCNKEMVRREAKRGPNKGDEFWGCSTYPKCHSKIFDKLTEDKPQASSGITDSASNKHDYQDLESVKPDTHGVWDPKDRREILERIYKRDSGRCGLCAAGIEIGEANIDHIVPKIFAFFNVYKGGKASSGKRYKSLLHREDNLQAAHAYCNKGKGNTSKTAKWRHPTMPPLGVAQAKDGTMFVIPWNPKDN